MFNKQKVFAAFAFLGLLAAAPVEAHEGYGRPNGYLAYPPPAYAYQPPIVHRPPPVYYRPWPPIEYERYWRHRHHHDGRGW